MRLKPTDLVPAESCTGLELSEGDLHLWLLDLDARGDDVDTLAALLSDDERVRSSRFRLALHRCRFVVKRAALRMLLARYLGGEAFAIAFRYGEHGKPSVDDPRLEFSVSDSEGLALFAFALDREVGVDIEQVREVSDADAIVRSRFTAAEQERYARLPAETRGIAFLETWTKKEAYLKAIGEGLMHGIDSFETTVATTGEDWTVYELRPTAASVGALVVRGPCEVPLFRRWAL